MEKNIISERPVRQGGGGAVKTVPADESALSAAAAVLLPKVKMVLEMSVVTAAKVSHLILRGRWLFTVLAAVAVAVELQKHRLLSTRQIWINFLLWTRF